MPLPATDRSQRSVLRKAGIHSECVKRQNVDATVCVRRLSSTRGGVHLDYATTLHPWNGSNQSNWDKQYVPRDLDALVSMDARDTARHNR